MAVDEAIVLIAQARALVHRAVVEKAIGRKLRASETIIDVLKLDAALNDAKDELEEAIRDEAVRATAAWANGTVPMVKLRVTEAMLAPLDELAAVGRAEALEELHRLGYTDAVAPGEQRKFAADPLPPEDRDLADYLTRNLPIIGLRIEDDLVVADLADLSRTALAEELLKIPGARDIASRIVSTALAEGLTLTFDANEDLVAGWEYTAVMDAATCDVCESHDGKRYETLAELYEDLPNFGPNPLCHGGGRCRCRGLPLGPGSV